jgi:hypothetical protein
LAMPPIAGLHDICAIRSTFRVYSAVFNPMRAVPSRPRNRHGPRRPPPRRSFP